MIATAVVVDLVVYLDVVGHLTVEWVSLTPLTYSSLASFRC